MQTYQPYVEAPVGRSDRYKSISTNLLVEHLERIGWEFRQQFGTRKGRGVHVVRMRYDKPIPNDKGEVLYPEIVIKNSFNGRSAFSAQVGIFRLVCSNGLTIVSEEFAAFKVRHMGTEAEIAVQSTIQVVEQFKEIRRKIDEAQKEVLTPEMAIELAMKASEVRFKKAFTPKQAEILLKAARPEDEGLDRWTVFNVLQEKLVNGGFKVPGHSRAAGRLRSAERIEKVNAHVYQAVMA